MIPVGNFFIFLRLLFLALLLLTGDLVHDVETIFHISYVLTASGNLFRNMSDAHETANAVGCCMGVHKLELFFFDSNMQ